MSLLKEFVTTGIVMKPRRILLYGEHGIGKSTFAANAPNPIFLPTEDGVSNIDCHSLPVARSWAEFQSYLEAVATEEHDYRTVVIDSVDWLETLIFKAVCEEHGKKSIEEFDYGKGYVFAEPKWGEVLRALDYLRDAKGMQSILISHAKIERFNDPTMPAYDRFAPDVHKRAAPRLMEWADDVLFATRETMTIRDGKQKDARVRAKQGGRVIRTTPDAAYEAKNRMPAGTDIPETIELSWAAYASYAYPSANQNQHTTTETSNGD